jgi:hypothetical protein
MEKLYDYWCKRSPRFETRYQESIFNVLTDYSKGVNQYQEARGKIFGAGYEVYILAFFIGLYFNQTKSLIEDKSKCKDFGFAVGNWGNIESRFGRNAYPRLREYIFAALVARTDIDFIAMDKGELSALKVAGMLIDKMEQYANFGLDFIREKLEQNPNYFFDEYAFIRLFMSFVNKDNGDANAEIQADEEPESLD